MAYKGLKDVDFRKAMKKTLLTAICLLLFWPHPSLGQRLANESKRGLHARSIDQVLLLNKDEVDLATAALIVSEQWSDMVQGRRYLAMLDQMALQVQDRLRDRWLRPTYKAIPVINHYLFQELRFRPVSEAEDPNDLFLHSVLDNRRGYCLSLSILYLSLAERLGMPLYGVVVPGHFFVRYDDGQTKWNIETTNQGANALDRHYIEKFRVPQGNDSGIYMKNLDKIQTLGCLFNNLGNTYCDMGDLDRALVILQTAVDINPLLAESRANLGNVYLKIGQIDQAINEYHQALQINPKDPKTYSNLANAYLQQDRLKDAISLYTEALQLDPNFVDAHKNLAIAYCRQQRFGLAIAQLKQALTVKPQSASLYSQLGEVYCQMEAYDAAISQYRQALLLERNSAEANYGLAICYHKLGMYDDEIQAYQKVLAVRPDMLPALVNLGNAYFSKENYEAAIDLYKRAVQIAPNDPRIHCNLAAAYMSRSDYEHAVGEYLKAVEIQPDLGDAHYGLAIGYYRQRKYESAWKHIRTAQKLGVDVTKEQLDAIKQHLR